MNPPALVTELSLESINKALIALANGISSTTGGATILLNTSTWFVQNNPTPPAGQICLETDTKFWKFGDGSTAYKSLSYQWKIPYLTPAPLPQTAAGVGQTGAINSGSGAALNAPVGGMWCVLSGCYQLVATNALQSWAAQYLVVAGGAQILAGVVGYYACASVMRIA